MPLLRLSEKLKASGVEHNHVLDEVIEKIHLHHEHFLDVIKHRNGKYTLESFIKNREPGVYSREEYLKVKDRVKDRVSFLNSLNLGTQFNQFAQAELI